MLLQTAMSSLKLSSLTQLTRRHQILGCVLLLLLLLLLLCEREKRN